MGTDGFCKALTAKGNPCPIPAVSGAEWCHIHHPEMNYRQQQEQRLAAKNESRAAQGRPPLKLGAAGRFTRPSKPQTIDELETEARIAARAQQERAWALQSSDTVVRRADGTTAVIPNRGQTTAKKRRPESKPTRPRLDVDGPGISRDPVQDLPEALRAAARRLFAESREIMAATDQRCAAPRCASFALGDGDPLCHIHSANGSYHWLLSRMSKQADWVRKVPTVDERCYAVTAKGTRCWLPAKLGHGVLCPLHAASNRTRLSAEFVEALTDAAA